MPGNPGDGRFMKTHPGKSGSIRRVAVAFFVCSLACFVLAACTRRNGSRPASASAGAPQRGGVLTIAVASLVTTFDPVAAGSSVTNIWTLPHLFARLVRTGVDGRSIEPDLAESWEVSADGRRYTFHLRQGLQFSDGSPLRASDVKFSLERAAKDPRNTQRNAFPPWGLEASDDRTVILTLAAPHAPLLALLTFPSASVLSRAYFERVGEKGMTEAPLGSGPFVLSRWRPGDRMILQRNPRFWETDRPYLDELRVLSIPDEMTRMLKIQAGEADVAAAVPFNQVEILRRAPQVDVKVAPQLEISFLGMNRRVAALKDPKVRRSLLLAIDREAIVRTVLFGHGSVAGSFLPQLLYSNDKPFVHDLAAAKRLLTESAYASGFSVSLLIFANSIQQQTAVLLKSQLEPLGIRIEIQQVESAQYWQRLQQGDTELTILGSRAVTADPAEPARFALMSDGFIATMNRVKNPTIDSLAAKAQAELDPGARIALYRQIEELALEDVPYVPLVVLTARDAVRTGVHGFKALPSSDTYRLWDVWKER